MPGVLEALAAIAQYIPVVKRPVRRPSLATRLLVTFLVLVIYYVMTVVPLIGVGHPQKNPFILAELILGMSLGTLATLGIGPIVTAGLVLEVLVGTGLIKLDITKERDRAIYMGAQKTLSLIFAAFEALAYAVGCTFWAEHGTCTASLTTRLLIVPQLVFATLLIMWFDEMLQRGWGIGSALSLFILAGVSKGIMMQMLAPPPQGLISYILSTGDVFGAIVRLGRPDLVGLIATFILIGLLTYLQIMRVEIPVTGPRLGGIKTRIPLNFIYVTNIPILLVAIVIADLGVIRSMFEAVGAKMLADIVAVVHYYASTPHGLLMVASDPVRAVTSAITWIVLSVLFGKLWVELAGLSPAKQAENLIRSGLEVPGLRRNKKILEALLARYIYPLTLLSSIIVGVIAVLADFLGAYGTGSGLILATGIAINFYQLLVYERTLEMYPLLRRILGE